MAIVNSEEIYRQVQRQHHIEDAERHVAKYLKNRNIDIDSNMFLFDMDALAETFEINHDCSIADNDQWASIVSEYVRANNLRFSN